MRLTRLVCKDFRCIEHAELHPSPGVNVIRGDNAQGKTTLLEAVLYLVTSKSHRTNQENELVRAGGEGFQLRCDVQRDDRTVSLEAYYWRGAKRVKVNGVAQTRISDILGRVNVVFFSPEDVELVRGPGSARRRFLDMELSQLSAVYLQALQNYRQILRQRNELLRKPRVDSALLEVWDEQMVAQGDVLRAERRAFVEELGGHAAEAHRVIAGGEELDVRYDPDLPPDADFAEVLLSARTSDLKQGVTTRGPHRDDLVIMIGGRRARLYGSQGQQRTAALALKLAELELVRGRVGENPILMLDDVLSELDEKRSRQLFTAIPDSVQCLVTTTDLTTRAGLFGPQSKTIHIREGRLEYAHAEG
jgi:DNA replication and repair protein RecF